MFADNRAVITPDEACERLVFAAPALISEHEVTLATGIAVANRPPVRRWVAATRGMFAVVGRRLAGSAHDGCPVGRGYPKRYAFLETACLTRAMERL